MSMKTIPLGVAVSCCTPLAAPSMSPGEAAATASLFKALADPARVRIVNMLAAADDGVCVCDLIPHLGLSQPTVSHHLRKLADAGLLHRRQQGTWAFYSLDREALARLEAVTSFSPA
jgi:ArsR family transcriptional regulator, arsenate/arsenite/antimonite-responsive transcriptional repressor